MSDIQELIEVAWTEFHNRQFPFDCEARMKNYAKEAFYAAYKAAPNPWIKISDIPEEWKDGRRVDLVVDIQGEYVISVRNCKYCAKRNKWMRSAEKYHYKHGGFIFPVEISDRFGANKITHAMLPIEPPAPPQQKETQ